ncbi:protein Fe65 homolog [Agrilus planipennis]|uniref:Protein Fe65 homolog n=1 Tax=Agrilus planipennis TaxID=224129 RepID=A0A1W4WR47_AGRPL|nr:protein Fe65 homolog [Agrilus planipennis]
MLCGSALLFPGIALSSPVGRSVSSGNDTRSPFPSLLGLQGGMATTVAQHLVAPDDEDVFLENGLLSYENPNYHLDPARLDDALNSNTESLYEELCQELDGLCRQSSNIRVTPNRKTYAALDVGSMGVDVGSGPLSHSTDYTDNRRNGERNGNAMCRLDNTTDTEAYSPRKSLDNDGPYYWHIKSGTIQREPPSIPNSNRVDQLNTKSSFSKETESIISKFENSILSSSVTRSSTSSALDLEGDERKRKEELTLKRRSYPARPEPETKEKPIRFAVRSLGWVEIAEEDLTPERSSKAVNKCIVDLSLGRNDLLDVVGRWGDGKDLFMDLDEGALKLIDPENLNVLNTQPIHTIRVWGVGRDNGRERDFAYVARDRSTRKHMCHVFRCDMPARTIANTLRDICKKIMIERSLQQNLAKPLDINGRGLANRPTNLPTEHRRSNRNSQALITQSFPTPMEEPKKVLRAQYLGSIQVTQATGMDILNDAISQLVTTVPQPQWLVVNVAIAPSMISIQQPNDDKLLVECRVRYLSFLGIGKNVKQCAFIMHTAQDIFMAHVFHCEPSSGALCKTIEAACKLRYQKCLDAHPQGFGRTQQCIQTPSRSFGAALKSIVGSLTGRKSKSAES